jgi:hypothetical protein
MKMTISWDVVSYSIVELIDVSEVLTLSIIRAIALMTEVVRIST